MLSWLMVRLRGFVVWPLLGGRPFVRMPGMSRSCESEDSAGGLGFGPDVLSDFSLLGNKFGVLTA